jgi:hypothetical protein
MGLTMGVALRLVELLAEALEFLFQLGDAAIALLSTGTGRTSRSHEAFSKSRVNVEELLCERFDPRCIPLIPGRTRGCGMVQANVT